MYNRLSVLLLGIFATNPALAHSEYWQKYILNTRVVDSPLSVDTEIQTKNELDELTPYSLHIDNGLKVSGITDFGKTDISFNFRLNLEPFLSDFELRPHFNVSNKFSPIRRFYIKNRARLEWRMPECLSGGGLCENNEMRFRDYIEISYGIPPFFWWQSVEPSTFVAMEIFLEPRGFQKARFFQGLNVKLNKHLMCDFAHFLETEGIFRSGIHVLRFSVKIPLDLSTLDA